MGVLRDCAPQTADGGIKIEKQQTKHHFSGLGHRGLFSDVLLVVGGQGAVSRCAWQAGQRIESRRGCSLNGSC
jgi:hypothetical protein